MTALDILLLRLDAPMMSFGAPTIDARGVTQDFPTLSMLTGLVANALGWQHRDFSRLDGLQERMRYAARCDRRGEKLRDYQTVDLGQDFMDADQVGWTTRGAVSKREGGSAKDGTHIRERDYWTDSVHTVALTLVPADATPTVAEVAVALAEPARPLFLGRKCCLPAAPLLLGVRQAPSLLAALREVPPLPERRRDETFDGTVSAWWFDGDDDDAADTVSRPVHVTDERDWRNQIHGGRRVMRHGRLRLAQDGGQA